jgi:hypothetical protein
VLRPAAETPPTGGSDKAVREPVKGKDGRVKANDCVKLRASMTTVWILRGQDFGPGSSVGGWHLPAFPFPTAPSSS